MSHRQPPPGIPLTAHMAAIVEYSDDAILTKDRNAIIRTWNPGAERLYGWSVDEAVGRPISILLPQHRVGEEYYILERILAGERVDHYETERVRRDGSSVWVSLTISPIRGEDGEVAGASVIARDITERREIEAERTRLLAEAQAGRSQAERSRKRLALVARASELLSESFEVEPPLQGVADLLVSRFAERCAIDLLEDGSPKTVAFARTGAPADGSQPELAAAPLLADVLSTGSSRVQHAEEGRDIWDGPGLGAGERASVVAAPIVADGRVLGTVAAFTTAADSYDDDDVELMAELGRRIGLSLEKARVYRAEHEVAVTLQRSLLPRELPELPGYAVAARYLPAARALNVGGDWYDLISTVGGSVVAAIGDVAGRGAEAASVMGQLRNAVRAYAFGGSGPAECAERVNLLMRSFETDAMATLALVAFPWGSEHGTLVRAGHLPPLIREPDGSVVRLEGQPCVPLGATSHPVYSESRHSLEPEATLVLFTDGLVERRGESIDDGLDRLERVLAQGPDDLEELAEFLTAELLGSGGELNDDVAVLLLRRLPVDATTFVLRQPAKPDALAPLRRELRLWLEGVAPPQARHDAVTACSEAAANVVEHAYPRGGGILEVHGRRGDDGFLELSVRDRGEWRPERDTGGGRGLKLIDILMDTVEVETGESGTEVRMRRRLNGGEAGQ